MSEQNPKTDEQERIRLGQSAARGATGDGQTGVRPGEQGMSNRPGDVAAEGDGDQAGDEDEDEDEEGGDDTTESR